MRKICLFCIGVFITFSSQSQILYLDNWKDIEGVKKITVSHYLALESLGEINVDKQLVKVIGIFNAGGKVIEEKVFFSEYDQPQIYHIFYNHTNGKVAELFHDYYEHSNREAGFKERVKFKYNQLGEIMVAETWCNLHTADCGATILDNNEYFILKDRNSDFNDENWLLTSRYEYSYDKNGNINGGRYKAKNSNTISGDDYPDLHFNIYENLKSKLFDFKGYAPGEQLIKSSLYPPNFDESKLQEIDVQIFKSKNPNWPLPEPYEYYIFDRKYDYTYNDRGDWEKCIIFDGEKPVRIILREIQY